MVVAGWKALNGYHLRDNPFKLSDLNGKTVTLVYGTDTAEIPWETLGAVDSDGKIYVLISREMEAK